MKDKIFVFILQYYFFLLIKDYKNYANLKFNTQKLTNLRFSLHPPRPIKLQQRHLGLRIREQPSQ